MWSRSIDLVFQINTLWKRSHCTRIEKIIGAYQRNKISELFSCTIQRSWVTSEWFLLRYLMYFTIIYTRMQDLKKHNYPPVRK